MSTLTRISHTNLVDVGTDLLLRDTHTWDRPEELWGLRPGPLGDTQSVGMPLPPGVQGRDPKLLLLSMAQASCVAVELGVPLPSDMIGFAFVAEAWGIMGTAARKRHDLSQAGAEVPDIADMDERQEGRLCLVGDLTGTLVSCLHIRGEDEIISDGRASRSAGPLVEVMWEYLTTMGDLVKATG